MATAWRSRGRELSLLFCGALVGYLVWVMLAARLGSALLAAWPGERSLAARLLLGAAVLDLSKAPPLLLLAWGLRRLVSLPPSVASLLLLGFSYGLELLAATALGPSGRLEWPALLSRLAAAAMLFVAVRWIFAGSSPAAERRCR